MNIELPNGNTLEYDNSSHRFDVIENGSKAVVTSTIDRATIATYPAGPGHQWVWECPVCGQHFPANA